MHVRKILILILTLFTTQLSAQVSDNRQDRITKEEFQSLLKRKGDFIPPDFGDTVVIIRYSGAQFLEMQNRARNISFAGHGSDTTSLRNQSWLTGQDIHKNEVHMEKSASEYPVKLSKELKNSVLSL